MNAYFCNIGIELSSRIDKPLGKEIELRPMNNNTLFLKPIDDLEILEIIDSLKIKNGGVDGINTNTLKHIFNICIANSIWPEALKIAELVPIFNSGNREKECNYRPISLISYIAKILERILYNRISLFLKANSILAKNQYGFINNRGTKDALSYVADKIYRQLHKSKPIAIAFLDLVAKAFDTVNHEILLSKLYNYGIRGNAYWLISSYLMDRKQQVRIGQTVSDLRELSYGVLQGTILGPLFFIIYVNDLLIKRNDEVMSYADDTAVI